MGVSFLKSHEYSTNEKDKNEIIKENSNEIHQNDKIYTECNYTKFSSNNTLSKHASQISQLSVNCNSINERYDKFSWTKIYRSPVPKRSCQEKLHQNDSPSNTNVLSPDRDVKEDCENVIKITAQTSTESFVRPKWTNPVYSKILPNVLCPCCGGGEDHVEESRIPYNNKSDNSNSYESIDLKKNSTTDFPLNIDACLMSMIYLQRNPKQKVAEFYTKTIRTLLRNTWKQFLYTFMFKRNHGPNNTQSELISSTLL